MFYTGDEEWNLPETLKSIPSEMEPYINDWRLPVIDLKTMDARKLMNRRLRDVVEINQSMFAGSYEGLRENRKIETESFVMAATFTRTNIRREDLPEGDEINMCKAMWAFLCLVSYMIFPAFRGLQSAAENMHLAQCRRCFSRVFNFEPARQDRRAVQQRTHSNLYGNKAVL